MNETTSKTLWDAADSHSSDQIIMTEDSQYLKEQLITYIGNKRNLLTPIGTALSRVQSRLGKDRLRILDGFAGSGIVSRFFKQYASELFSNDLELYANIIGNCYLANRSEVDLDCLQRSYDMVNRAPDHNPITDGIIRRMYAPADDDNIQPGERAFYTVENAVRIDTLRHRIGQMPIEQQLFLLAPLLSRASVHTNTSGVFKGFYKNRDGVGQYGGQARNALTRILKPIELPFPVFSSFECPVEVSQADTNTLVRTLKNLDVAYFDPPYNQHPYGSNYFMLNIIATNKEPESISRVSGIPTDWNRSRYNKAQYARNALEQLITDTDSSHILVSYNCEGFVSRAEFEELLGNHGKYEVIETKYNTFRGSRNLRGRSVHVTEQLFLLERS